MALPLQLPDQVQVFADRLKAALDDFFRKAADKAGELRGRLPLGFNRSLGTHAAIGPGKGRIIVIAAMGGVAVFILIIAGVSLAAKSVSKDSKTTAAEAPLRQGLIPHDELFLPDEPDFIPGILLGREQRTIWTADDAEPLWQDPLKNGEEPWRDRIEQAIDEIMEGIP